MTRLVKAFYSKGIYGQTVVFRWKLCDRIRIKVGFLSLYYILNDYRNYVKIEKFQGFYRI